MTDNDAAQLEELRLYFAREDQSLSEILEAARELAQAFLEYEDHHIYGVPDASEPISRLVSDVLAHTMRDAAQKILRRYPMMKEATDDIQDMLKAES